MYAYSQHWPGQWPRHAHSARARGGRGGVHVPRAHDVSADVSPHVQSTSAGTTGTDSAFDVHAPGMHARDWGHVMHAPHVRGAGAAGGGAVHVRSMHDVSADVSPHVQSTSAGTTGTDSAFDMHAPGMHARDRGAGARARGVRWVGAAGGGGRARVAWGGGGVHVRGAGDGVTGIYIYIYMISVLHDWQSSNLYQHSRWEDKEQTTLETQQILKLTKT